MIDPKEASVVYTASQFGNTARLDLKASAREKIRPRPELSAEKKEKPLRYNWITPFLLSPHSRDVLYFGANRLYRSFDRGDTWTALSDDLTSDREQGNVPFGTLTSIAESPRRFGVIWVGTDEGKVWGTRDGGGTWTDLSAGLAQDRWVTRVVASAFDEGTLYVTQSGYRNDDFAPYVFRSTDYGRGWESLSAGLPAEPVNVVREDPKARHLLYMGTDGGAFVSLDRGKSWTALTGGLPHVAVQDLAVHPREGDLVLATHGRSVYLAEAAPLRKLTEEAMAKPLAALPVKSVPGDPRRGYGAHPYLTWFRDDPVVRLAYWAAAPGTVSLTIKDENGNAWKQLTDTAARGLNVVEYDLSADAKLADAAEAAARAKALEEKKARAARGGGEPKPAAVAEEEEDEGAEDKAAAAAGKPMLDADLQQLLADPLHASRKRFLPPGRYTVEFVSGARVEKTALVVKPPREGGAPAEDEGAR